MKKLSIFASLAVITASVSGMTPLRSETHIGQDNVLTQIATERRVCENLDELNLLIEKEVNEIINTIVYNKYTLLEEASLNFLIENVEAASKEIDEFFRKRAIIEKELQDCLAGKNWTSKEIHELISEQDIIEKKLLNSLTEIIGATSKEIGGAVNKKGLLNSLTEIIGAASKEIEHAKKEEELMNFLIEKVGTASKEIEHAEKEQAPKKIKALKAISDFFIGISEKDPLAYRVLEKNCNSKYFGMHKSLQNMGVNLSEFFEQCGDDINDVSCQRIYTSPLYYVCKSGNKDLVAWFLDCGADININNPNRAMYFWPITGALESGNPDLVKYLVKYIVDKGIDGKFLLRSLINNYLMKESSTGDSQKDFELIEYLFENANGINKEFFSEKGIGEQTLLFDACSYNNLDMVKYLVDKGAVITNEKDGHGDTMLFTACHNNNLEMMKYLVDKGAVVTNEKNLYGETLLFIACYNNNLDMVKYLVDKGAVVTDEQDRCRRTLLSVAQNKNNEDLLNYLKRQMVTQQ